MPVFIKLFYFGVVVKIFVFSRFGLFEAMSAIEMMDPKMDAGMMCNQINRKVFNLEQAVTVMLL
jgi:hypothetical protein